MTPPTNTLTRTPHTHTWLMTRTLKYCEHSRLITVSLNDRKLAAQQLRTARLVLRGQVQQQKQALEDARRLEWWRA